MFCACTYVHTVCIYIFSLNRCQRIRRKHISSTKQETSNNDIDIETNIGYSIVHQNSYLEEDSLSLCEDVETHRPPPRDSHRELAIPTIPVCYSTTLTLYTYCGGSISTVYYRCMCIVIRETDDFLKLVQSFEGTLFLW